MVGGTLLVGSQLQRRLPAILPPIGQVYVCPPGSNPDEPGPVDQARPTGLHSATAFDRRAGRLVVVTTTGTWTSDTGQVVETWTFDVCTNTWTQMHPSREPPPFDWARLVYDIDSDATILFSPFHFGPSPSTGWRVWAYDLQANTWTEKQAPPTGPTGDLVLVSSVAYDPVTGLVVAGGSPDSAGVPELWNYDVETDAWTQIHQANGPRFPLDFGFYAYDASVDRLVAYGDAAYGAPPYETWLFDIRTGTWSRSAAERPPVVGWLTAPGLVYDEAAERTVVFMRSPLTAYDASADRWEILAGPETLWEDPPGVEVYDAVNRRLVGWGDSAVVAFDLTTREWTVLLEPSGLPSSTPAARPAPTSARTPTPPGGTEETGLTSPVPTASPTSAP
jgi:hypothetical protein